MLSVRKKQRSLSLCLIWTIQNTNKLAFLSSMKTLHDVRNGTFLQLCRNTNKAEPGCTNSRATQKCSSLRETGGGAAQGGEEEESTEWWNPLLRAVLGAPELCVDGPHQVSKPPQTNQSKRTCVTLRRQQLAVKQCSAVSCEPNETTQLNNNTRYKLDKASLPLIDS